MPVDALGDAGAEVAAEFGDVFDANTVAVGGLFLVDRQTGQTDL